MFINVAGKRVNTSRVRYYEERNGGIVFVFDSGGLVESKLYVPGISAPGVDALIDGEV